MSTPPPIVFGSPPGFNIGAFGQAPQPANLPTPNTQLLATIPSYVYQQYQDDSDLQAFAAAFNTMAQTYVTWFANVSLPIYTNLSGTLLDWVLFGLYGIPRTSLASPSSAALGPINTTPINALEISASRRGTSTRLTASASACDGSSAESCGFFLVETALIRSHLNRDLWSGLRTRPR
jgi:hypothetical protein